MYFENLTATRALTKTKAKSPTPIKSKTGKTDAITGAKFILNGFTIESDKIYSGNSPIRSLFGTATLSEPRLTNWSMEFEFGNPQFFIQTAKSTYIDDLGRSTEFIERYVSEGAFKYSNGRMTSARIDKFYSDYYKIDSDGHIEQMGFSTLLNSLKGAVIKNPSSATSWVDALTPEKTTFDRNTEYHNMLPPPGSASSDTIIGNEAAFRSLSVAGRFLADGWWNNPLTTNLV